MACFWLTKQNVFHTNIYRYSYTSRITDFGNFPEHRDYICVFESNHLVKQSEILTQTYNDKIFSYLYNTLLKPTPI